MIGRFFLLLLGLLVAAIALPPLWFAWAPEPVPELPPAGRRVEVSPGVAVNVIEAGAGPPVVLVHGHPGTAYDWSELLPALAARGLHAIAYDRVGYGRSDARTNGAYTIDGNADDLVSFLAAEGLEDATVVGHSYGGGVVIAAAHKDAERMGRLVLVGSVGPGIEKREAPPPLVADLLRGPGLSWVSRVPPVERALRAAMTKRAFAPEPVRDGFLDLLAANFGRPGTLTTFRSEGQDVGFGADVDPQWIEQPILVIHGEEDRLVPLGVGQELAKRAKHGELWAIPDAGHMLLLTHAAAIADRIAAFAGVQ